MKIPMKNSRWIAYNGIMAALYAAMTIAVAPLSYGPIQLRISECLKSIVIWHPALIPAFVLGNALSNLFSPFIGAWELLWMPVANLVGGWICSKLGKINKWLGAVSYAIVTALAVSLMLSTLLGETLMVLFPMLLVGELVTIVGGVPMMERIGQYFRV